MTNQESKSIRDDVLKAIDTGKVIMRPKWHFLLQAGLMFFGLILAVLALLYLVSFIIFILHQTGAWFVPGFGLNGLRIFFISLPWLLILAAIIFLIILEILVKRYSFGYRKPLLYSTMGVIGFVLLGGLVVAGTSFHRGLFERARDNDLPFAGGLYRQFGDDMPPQNLAIGTVIEELDSGFRIQDPRGEIMEVVVGEETVFWNDQDININDNIAVLGDRDALHIIATAIRKIEARSFPPPPHMRTDFRPPR